MVMIYMVPESRRLKMKLLLTQNMHHGQLSISKDEGIYMKSGMSGPIERIKIAYQQILILR
ncbi:TPA: hypothetical protein MIU04_27155 [Klebsiella pneumoniae]|nr:hypothetical protein [Klebsiella pneumoniae]